MEKNPNLQSNSNSNTENNINQRPEEVSLNVVQNASTSISDLTIFPLFSKTSRRTSEDETLKKNFDFSSQQHYVADLNYAKNSKIFSQQNLLEIFKNNSFKLIVDFFAQPSPTTETDEYKCTKTVIFGSKENKEPIMKLLEEQNEKEDKEYMEMNTVGLDFKIQRVNGNKYQLWDTIHAQQSESSVKLYARNTEIVLLFPEDNLSDLNELIEKINKVSGNKLIYVVLKGENLSLKLPAHITCQGVFHLGENDSIESFLSRVDQHTEALKTLVKQSSDLKTSNTTDATSETNISRCTIM